MAEFSFITKNMRLPTPCPVLRRIGEAVESPEASVASVFDALKLDPVLAGKTLRIANSSYAGMPRNVSSLKNAVALLGIKRIRSLVLAARFTHAPDPPAMLGSHWRHATAVAHIAESIARHLKRYDPIDEQETFSAAILHDIGKLALAVYDPERATLAAERSWRESLPFYKAEGAECAHTEAGRRLAECWGLPPDLSAAIAGHHDPFAQDRYARLAAIVHVADVMSHILGFSTFEGEAAPPVDERALGAIGLPPERLRAIAETELENHRRIETSCGMFQES